MSSTRRHHSLFWLTMMLVLAATVHTALTTRAQTPALLINEFLPWPLSGDEWVELYNAGNVPIDATGWQIADAYNDTPTIISASTVMPGYDPSYVAPGAFLLVRLTPAILNDGPAGGDTVRLLDSSGTLIDSTSYTSTTPNYSYARIPDGSSNWSMIATSTPGMPNDGSPLTATATPTTTDTPLPADTATPTATDTNTPSAPAITSASPPVLINELLSVSSDNPEWIEVYNPGDTSVSIEGWRIQSDRSGGTAWHDLEPLTVPAHGFAVYQFANGLLSVHGGVLALLDSQGNIVGETVSYPALTMGQVYARTTDGAATWSTDYPPSPRSPNMPATPTPTATPTSTATSAPTATPTPALRLLLINECLPAPAPGNAEWLELYNPGNTPVSTAGWIVQRTSQGGTVQEQALPDVTLPAVGFAAYEVSSSFLPNDGATLVLFDAQGRIVGDPISYPAMAAGQVYARTTDGAATWSSDYPPSPGSTNLPPPPTATPTATQSPEPTPEPHMLRINEVLPDPSGNTDAETEWIELYNPADTAVSTADWRIRRVSESGTERWQTLNDTTLVPGGFAVYSFDSGFLPNSGATLTLFDAQGRAIGATVSYPALSAGQGYAYTTDAASWRDDYPLSPGAPNMPPAASATPTHTATAKQSAAASSATNTPTRTPTPGSRNTTATLHINEVMAAPASGENEWIELYNPADTAESTANWRIRRVSESGTERWQTLNDTTLAAGAFAVFSFDSGFLPNSGATLTLFDAGGNVVDEAITYPSLATSQSYSRTSDGGAAWCTHYPCSPGAANTSPTPTASRQAPITAPSPTTTATSTAASTATAAPTQVVSIATTAPTHRARPTSSPSARPGTATSNPTPTRPTATPIPEAAIAAPAGVASISSPSPTVYPAAMAQANLPAPTSAPSSPDSAAPVLALAPTAPATPAPLAIRQSALPQVTPHHQGAPYVVSTAGKRYASGEGARRYSYQPASQSIPRAALPSESPATQRQTPQIADTGPSWPASLIGGLLLVGLAGGGLFIGLRHPPE